MSDNPHSKWICTDPDYVKTCIAQIRDLKFTSEKTRGHIAIVQAVLDAGGEPTREQVKAVFESSYADREEIRIFLRDNYEIRSTL